MRTELFSAFDLLPSQIAVLDRSGEIVATNTSWQRTAAEGSCSPGNAANYLRECERAARRGCQDAETIASGIHAVLSGGTDLFSATYPCAFAGLHHWYQVDIAAARVQEERGAIIMHMDVSTLQHDGLTKLPNRAFFDAQLHYILDEAASSHRTAGMVLLDLNGFKPVNDAFGHLAGDLVLREIAGRLATCAKPGELVARLGGDEFGIVLAAGDDRARAEQLDAQIDLALAPGIRLDGHTAHVGASIGLSIYPDDGSTAEALFRVADARMYESKRRHQDRAGTPARG